MKTKSIAIILFCLLFSGSITAQTVEKAPKASKLMAQAFKQAKAEGKQVFLIFHASWCGWCHRMDSLMTREDTKEIFDRNFVTVHLVVSESKDKKHLENPGAEKMRQKLNCEKTGIPFWVIYDSKKKVLADAYMRPDGALTGAPGTNTGCPATAEEVAYWIKVLKATSDLNNKELDLVAKLFKR